jgi:N-acyl-D-amino-acid deacylase
VADSLLDEIRSARASGLDITADTGVYAAFPACIGASILDGDLKSKYGPRTSAANLTISSGIYAGEICSEQSFRYLRDEFPNTLVTVNVLDESEIEKFLREDWIYVSTNAVDGPHYDHVGHPETAGSFPRLIKRYVRENPVLSIVSAIEKISLLPATRFRLDRRGELREGNFADITIFDYERLADTADYVGKGDPNRPPLGIEYVIVNGQTALERGRVSAGNPGVMLTASPDISRR